MLQLFMKDKIWDPAIINHKTISKSLTSALIIAADGGFTDEVKIVLDQPGVDMNIADENKYTELFHANNKDIVELMLDKSKMEEDNPLKKALT